MWWNRLHRHENLIYGFLPPEPEDVEQAATVGLVPGYRHVILNVNVRTSCTFRVTSVTKARAR